LEEGDNKLMFAPTKIIIKETEIEDISDYAKTTVKWEAIEKIAVNENYIFLYANANQAYIIPKRSFQDKKYMDTFIQTINRYHSNVNSRSPPPSS